MSANNQPIPDLGQVGRVVVLDWRLLPTSGLDAHPEPLTRPDAIGHLRLVDPVKARAYLCPMNRRSVQTLRDQLEQLLAADAPDGTLT